MAKNKTFIGAKSSKSGSSQTTPVEAVDSLRSRSYARLLDAVSEGEIVGLVDGFKSIYFDDVAVQNTDGTYNFKNCAVNFSNGSTGQPYMGGAAGTESTQNIGVALKYNVPAVRTIVNAEADVCRVLIATGQMLKTNTTNGDTSGTQVEHKIEYRSNGGAWQLVKNDVINGKTMAGYEREISFTLAGVAPWDVRVTRLTADSTSQTLINSSQWSSLTSVIEEKLRYPCTALVGIQIDAEQFSGIPRRAYDIKGLVVKVPANYDPITHTYSGSWNGAFKMAWTDNPAWCMYNLLTNKRYGLGSRIDVGMLDKWKLYEIGKYCDEPVPNGHGGTEPRFTCNLYVQTRQEAYKLIQDMATIFRGISYWASGSIVVAQDSPQPIRYQFNNTNVEGGIFERAGSNIQTRHNVALVTWNDPDDMYRQKIEYVEDFAAIEKMGYVSESEVVAFGCASQGQARRYGEWLLYTELYESEVLTFVTGMEGNIPLPNDIIQVSDVYHAGERRGGRVLAGSTTTSVVLDAPVVLESGKTYTLSVIDVNGVFRSSAVSSATGTYSTLTVSAAYAQAIAENSTWILSNATLAPETMRVVGIEETEAGKYKIACLASNPAKFGFVERNQSLQAPPTSNLQQAKPDVKNVVIKEEAYLGSGEIPMTRIAVSFAPANAVSTAFFIEYKAGDGAWQRTPKTAQFYAEIMGLSEGVPYIIRVVAGNQLLGVWNSKPAEYTFTPTTYIAPPVTGLSTATAWQTGEDVQFKWDSDKKIVNYDIEIIANGVVVRTITVQNTQFVYTAQDMRADGGFWRAVTFKVRSRSNLGRTSEWSQIVVTNPQVGALTGFKFSSGLLEAYLEYAKPSDGDFAGVRVWLGTDPNFATIDSNCVYDGNASLLTLNKQANGAPLDGGVTYYVKLAGYDTFGKDGLTISAALGFTVYSVSAMAKDLSESNLAAALKSRIDLVDGSGAGSVTSRIAAESNNRTVAISAETTNRLNQIATESSNRAAAIAAEAAARGTADAQLSTSISTIAASTNTGLATNTAAIQTEQTARANADTALGSRIDVVISQSTTDRTNAAAAVSTETTARTNADSALSSQITTLTATVNGNNSAQSAAIQTEQTARANADGTLSGRIDSMTATQTSDRNTLTASIQTEATARTTADNALTTRVDAVIATINSDRSNATAAVSTEATARANADSALSQQISTVQTSVNGNTASIQTQATSINGLQAQYTVKTDVNGYVSGFGLATTPNNGAPQSSFIINADKFGVGSAGKGTSYPFIVDTVKNVIGVNGTLLVDGTVNATAIVANSITSDKIATNSITTNHLQAGSISSDKLMVGASSNMLVNAGFESDFYGWSVYQVRPCASNLFNLNADWCLSNTSNKTHAINYAAGGTNEAADCSLLSFVLVEPGKTYIASAYVGVHRCRAVINAFFHDVNGNYLASSNNDLGGIREATEAFSGGKYLSGYKRIGFRVLAPANAVRMVFEIVKYGNPTTDSWMFTTRPYAGECLPNQTELPPWDAAGATTIGPGNVKTDTLSAITSNLGSITGGSLNINNRFIVAADGTTTIRSSTTGQRTEMDNQQFRVYDTNGVLRVRLGIW